ncbi:siderophore-interacting protein [Demequina mangrovi]|uniref:NADPH-dependent ferric siderophore reductase, contains FAD-binding and SIP domains n=1 Tax=Demequina mangrovi TaxID=1043493 RepID=A0A1H7AQ23_9MICO|nr:siderophore-interacting protein [Demequina mangrovi]SEJ63125.1 NADPH-dependent ferric siderophore reductase, contains FAD-binding and SIP domains [Demequina mangrovi]
MPRPERPDRPVRTLTVVRTERLTPAMVRVILTGPDLDAFPPLTFTDHYVKLRFGDVTRTYTIRSLDLETRELAIDFVVHGDEGLAGPWAATAQPGDALRLVGPGGAWAPSADADAHLLVGDEAALPAIAAALDRLATARPDARVEVYLEVAGPADEQPLATTSRTAIHWIHRTGADAHGEALTRAVVGAERPVGRVEAFVHGNADMVKPLRRHLFHTWAIPREQVSISGYWRTGMNEDGWQAGKREFNARMEAEQDAPV